MNITYKEIAKLINKTEQGIKYYSSHNPELLEILKLGSLLKKYNIEDKDTLLELIELNDIIINNDIKIEKIKAIVDLLKED